LLFSNNINPKLKPCPFCRSKTIIAFDHHLICLQCGAKGPHANSMREALILWDMRVPEIDARPEAQMTDEQSD